MATARKTARTPAVKTTPPVRAPRPPASSTGAGEASQIIRAAAQQVAASRDASTSAANLTSELNNIDFRKMIGGPLQAVVDAQVASALSTVNFIKEVGFKKSATGGADELVMVPFTHERQDVGPDGKPLEKKTVGITVPLLAMLPIPSLRIEHVIIDFNVKLNSVEASSQSTALGVSASVGGGFGPVNFKVSASFQRKTSTSVEVKKEYALQVSVKAVQDEIPAGLEKVLNALTA